MSDRHHTQFLDTLTLLAQEVAAGADAAGVCGRIAEGMMACFGADGARLALREAAGHPLRVVAQAGRVPGGLGSPRDPGREPGALFLCPDLDAAPDFPERDALAAAGVRGFLRAPLVHAGEVLGVVELLSPAIGEETRDRIAATAEAFATQAAALLSIARRLDQAREERAWWRLLVQNLPVGVQFVQGTSSATAVIREAPSFWSDQASWRLTPGMPLSRMPHLARLYPPDRKQLLPFSRLPSVRAVDRGERVRREELHFLTPEGRWWVFLVDATPIREEGRITGAVVVSRDVTEAWQMGEALRRVETRFRQLAEHAQEMVCRLVFDPGPRFEYVSPSAEVLTGYTLDEFYTTSEMPFRLVDPEDQSLLLALVRCPEHAPRPMLMRWRHKDGLTLWLEVHTMPEYDETGAVVAIEAIARDVTERKQMEDLLRQSEARYRTLVERIPAVTYTTPLHAYQEVVYVSPQVEALLGYTTDEWAREPGLWLQRIHPEDREWVSALAEEQIARGDPFSCEYRLIARDGRVVWVRDEVAVVRDGQSRPLLLQGFLIDITGRRRMERALRESEERFRLLSASAPICIFQMDAEGRCVYVNPRWEALTGRSAAEAMGDGWAETLHPEDRPGLLREWADTIRALGEWSCEARLLTPSGIRWVRARAMPMHSEVGAVRGYVGTVEDISERKQAEEEHQRLIHDLEAERARLDAVLRQMPAGVVIADAPGARITYWNDHVAGDALSAKPLDEGGGDYAQFHGFHPDGRPYRFEEWPLVRASAGEVVVGEEIDFLHADGRRRTHRASAGPIRDREGRTIAGVVVVTDITEEKRAKAGLRVLTEMGALAATLRDPGSLLPEMVGRVVPEIADWCVVHLEGNPAAPLVAHANRERVDVVRATWGHLALGASASEEDASPEGVRIVAEVASDLPPGSVGAGLRRAGVESYAVAPLAAPGGTLGVMVFALEGPRRRFGPDDAPLLAEIARRVAQAVERDRATRRSAGDA